MTELLSRWMPQPEHAPAGVMGLLLVVGFLAASAYASHLGVLGAFAAGFVFLAGVALCITSVAHERSRLFGYLGITAAVLYLCGELTTSFLALMT